MTRLFAQLILCCLSLTLAHAEDSGKQAIGKIKATLYIGSDSAPQTLGDNTKKWAPVPATTTKRFQHIASMRFKHYQKLGEDTQSVFRSYENWLAPLKPSEEILLSFESRGIDPRGGLLLDLEFWQHRRKVMKSAPRLKKGTPLLILGPKWRGGTLIIAVELIEVSSQ